MKAILTVFFVIGIFLSGCAPQIYLSRPDPVMGINIYTVDGSRIVGNWIYVIDDSVVTASRQIKTSSHACSLHTYQISAGDSLSASISHAMEKIFINAVPRKALPSEQSAQSEGLTGALIIKLDEFYPRINCSMGQFEGYCTASTDLSFSISLIDYTDMTTNSLHASAQRTAEGGSGEWCDGVSNIISESVKRSTKDVLERISEKISVALILNEKRR